MLLGVTYALIGKERGGHTTLQPGESNRCLFKNMALLLLMHAWRCGAGAVAGLFCSKGRAEALDRPVQSADLWTRHTGFQPLGGELRSAQTENHFRRCVRKTGTFPKTRKPSRQAAQGSQV